MSRILIIGAYGFLGCRLSASLAALGHEVVRQGRGAAAQLQGDPLVAAAAMIGRVRPDAVINLAAMTDVDGCEKDPAEAFQANVSVVEALTGAVSYHPGVHLVHVSTDQLYDGQGPHDEDVVRPINVYGITKYAGEMAAARAAATILRVNFVGRAMDDRPRGFSDWVVGKLRSGDGITAFDDVLFSPLHAGSLCAFIERAVAMRRPGVFNLGARGGISKAAFILGLAGRLGLDTSAVQVGRSSDVALKARRPLDMRMRVDRYETTFGVALPDVEAEITRTASEYGAS